MTLDLAKIKSDAEIIASRCDTLLMPLPVKDVLGMLSELEKFDDSMRALAFQLSAGGYNAKTLTAEQLVSKVSDGLKAFADSTEALVDGIRKDAERYRGVRRVANRQGFTDEQFDQQTDTRIASFDAAMAKDRP